MGDKTEATVILHSETEKALLVSETEDGKKSGFRKVKLKF